MDEAMIESTTVGGTPTVTITGPNLAVRDGIAKVFSVYPPQAYNTRVVRVDILSETTLRAVVTHWGSSD